jgi:hypothetical protein
MPLVFDFAAAKDFLGLLDPTTDKFHFSAFDDRKREDVRAWHAYGTFDELSEKLQRRNEAGLGVFITVNGTDGHGRRATNIRFPRAVWADMDDGVRSLADWPIPPNLTVFTSKQDGVQRGQHYWLIDWNGDEANLTPEQHGGVQNRLVEGYGADPGAIDYARVLRLPGFFHMKAAPQLVTFEAHGNRGPDGQIEVLPYLPSDLLRAFPPLSKKGLRKVLAGAGAGKVVATLDTPSVLEQARAWLVKYAPSADSGNRNTQVVAVANMLGDRGVSEDQAVDLMLWWNDHKCEPPIDMDGEDSEGVRAIRSAYRSRQNALGVKTVEAEVGDILVLEADASAEDTAAGEVPETHFQYPVITKKGEPDRQSPKNLDALLGCQNIKVRKNLFNNGIFAWWTRNGETVQQAVDDDFLSHIIRLAHNSGFKITKTDCVTYLTSLAAGDAYHPVRDFLTSLEWDGLPRLDTWLVDYAGAEDKEINRAFGRCTILGAVARVCRPGTKHDTLLVLEGPQGSGKSELVGALGGEWSTEGLTFDLSSKEIMEVTENVWIAEIAELVGLGTKESNRVKRLLSSKAEKARKAYDRLATNALRQFIMIGTTNHTQYLRDLTGDRRYWPVACAVKREIDVSGFRKARDQILAEALHRLQAGESNVLPPHLWAEAALVQESRRMVSSLEEDLTDLLGEVQGKVLLSDVRQHLMKRGHLVTGGGAQMLADLYQRLGWSRVQRRRRGSNPLHAIESGGSDGSRWLVIRGGRLVPEDAETGLPDELAA